MRLAAVRAAWPLLLTVIAAAQVEMKNEPHHHLVFHDQNVSVFQPVIPAGERNGRGARLQQGRNSFAPRSVLRVFLKSR